jgi:hypothetical protein
MQDDRRVSVVSAERLERVEHHYRRILASMSDPLAAFVAGSAAVEGDYAGTGFVKVRGVLPADAFVALVDDLLPVLGTVAQRVVLRHQPTPDGKLSDGASFARIDPGFALHAAQLSQLLDMLGLLAFGELLAARVAPLVRYLAGDVGYERIYCYVYEEGDYLSVHDDSHVGDRVDVQFTHSIGACGGLRVLTDGMLRMHYDDPGSMNVLGPRVWHDVPPLLRATEGVVPRRINLGLRFVPPATRRDRRLDPY